VSPRWLWALAAIPLASVAACSGHRGTGLTDDSSDDGTGPGGGGGGDDSTSPSNTPGTFVDNGDGSTGPVGNSGPCKGGHYSGAFAGLYTSHLTGVGVPIPVAGNVDMTLDQQGTADMTCHPAGEIPVPCNDVFTLKDGTITGVADQLHLGDAAVGGFPSPAP